MEKKPHLMAIVLFLTGLICIGLLIGLSFKAYQKIDAADQKMPSVIDPVKTKQKAMKEENMSWTQGRIEGGIYGAGAKEYNIQAIPMCLILDKEGRFYKTNMRGAYLDVFLDDLYKAN